MYTCQRQARPITGTECIQESIRCPSQNPVVARMHNLQPVSHCSPAVRNGPCVD